MEPVTKLTLGESRVRTEFNPSDSNPVAKMKGDYASIINTLDAIKNDEVSKTYDKSPEALKQQSGERLRLISIAQTKAEEAAMWAVKAITC